MSKGQSLSALSASVESKSQQVSADTEKSSTEHSDLIAELSAIRVEPTAPTVDARTYYTYRITAADSAKYYYGVSHVKAAGASAAQCLASRYFGSGGAKFANWKSRHRLLLKKEVLATFSTREEAFSAERELVGELYRTDPNCLNSTTGGKYAGPVTVGVNLRDCLIHGLVAHNAEYCYSCLASERYTLKECLTHGLTKHSGESCYICVSEKTFSERNCPIHGSTIFRGESCNSCTQSAAVSLKECEVHGVAKHIGEVCYSCISLTAEVYTQKVCKLHGEVTFRGNSCALCSAQKSITIAECSIHGETKYKSGKCCSCLALKAISEVNCELHGKVKTQNGNCSRCEGSKRFYLANCELHGERNHRTSSGSCVSCETAARNCLKECPTHGVTMHQSSSCCKCVAEKSVHTRQHLQDKLSVVSCKCCEKP